MSTIDIDISQRLSKDEIKEVVSKRVAREFNKGDVVTLGIGLPTAVANYVSPEAKILFHAESGILGTGKGTSLEETKGMIINAGGQPVELVEGGAFFDAQMAFTMMRGAHINATVLGALEVDEEGSLASWIIPGKLVPGMGGAMDLVVGAQRVIVAMEHTSRGNPKILKKCTLPLTAYKEVDLIVTERCVFKTVENGLLLTEINPAFTLDEIKDSTVADFEVASELLDMTKSYQ